MEGEEEEGFGFDKKKKVSVGQQIALFMAGAFVGSMITLFFMIYVIVA